MKTNDLRTSCRVISTVEPPLHYHLLSSQWSCGHLHFYHPDKSSSIVVTSMGIRCLINLVRPGLPLNRGSTEIDLFTVFDAVLAEGQTQLKLTVNVWDFGPLGTTIMPLRKGWFPTLDTTLNSFIDIIHSTENKAIKEGTTSVNLNYKSSHVASNLMVICIMLIRRICMKS